MPEKTPPPLWGKVRAGRKFAMQSACCSFTHPPALFRQGRRSLLYDFYKGLGLRSLFKCGVVGHEHVNGALVPIIVRVDDHVSLFVYITAPLPFFDWRHAIYKYGT